MSSLAEEPWTRPLLDQVYGAIAYSWLIETGSIDILRPVGKISPLRGMPPRDADPMFYQKLAEAKKHTPLAR